MAKETPIGASLISMACLILFLKVWQPKALWTSPALRSHDDLAETLAARPNKSGPPPKPGASLAVSAGVDHRLHHIAALGHQLVQGSGQSHGDLELCRPRAR